MMRIAFVAGGLPLGGSSTFTLFLSAALQRLGVPVEVFSFRANHPLKREFEEAGVPVHTEDEGRLIYEDRLQKLYERLRAFRPTAVFAVLGSESFEMLRYVPAGVARIGILHDRTGQLEISTARYRATMDHLVVVAAYLLEDVHRLAPQFPSTYLAHGIPLPENVPSRTPTEHSKPLRLLYYGRLENAAKGVRLFPEIVAALKRRQVSFCWTIHGYGPEEKFLKAALADEVRDGHVRFSSPVPYDQLSALVRQHDVYLLASINEGGPLTLLESMALGLVPVCGDIPCLIQEVIAPQNGFRVPRDQPDAYAEAILKLHADRQLLESMSQAAKTTITNEFSAGAMAHRYISFLETQPASTKSVLWPEKIRVLPILETNPFYNFGPILTARRIMKKF
jgi:glycosyltransferase involved in cell wall biosynthesis